MLIFPSPVSVSGVSKGKFILSRKTPNNQIIDGAMKLVSVVILMCVVPLRQVREVARTERYLLMMPVKKFV